MNQQTIISEFEKLPLAEKADLLDKLWSAYQSEEERTDFTPDELEELDLRMASYLADPSTATDADIVHERLRNRNRDAS